MGRAPPFTPAGLGITSGRKRQICDQIYKPLHEYIQRSFDYSYKLMTNDEIGI